MLHAYYNNDGTLQSYYWRWWSTPGTHKVTSETTWFNSDGTVNWNDLYQYRDPDRANFWDATDHLWLGSNLDFAGGGADTQDFDAPSHRVTADYHLSGSDAQWSRTTHDYLPTFLQNQPPWEYRTTWSDASATPLPDAPTVNGTAPAAPVPPTTPYDEAAHPNDPLNGITLPDTSSNSNLRPLNWPASLHVPGSWTMSHGEYLLPGLNYANDGGRIAIEFDGQERPVTLTWAQNGLANIQTNFTYDAFGNLLSRVVQYGGNPVLSVSLSRDAQDRITQVKTAGSMMKIPLVYDLTYPVGKPRPDTLTVSVQPVGQGTATPLLGLRFSYDPNKTSTVLPFGLGALNFDETITDITLSVGTIPALEFDFQPDSGGSKIVDVYDVLGKGGQGQPAKVLKGRLLWTVDAEDRPSGLEWHLASGGVVDSTATWSYHAAWGTYAQIASDATLPAQTALSDVEAKVQDLLSTAESFDIEKLFQLASSVQSAGALADQQFQRTASNLIDQVKAATGQ